jgi:hypothetical protein
MRALSSAVSTGLPKLGACLALLFLAGCLSTPSAAVEPAADAPAPQVSAAVEPRSAGLFTADSEGRLTQEPALPGWTVRPEGGWVVDVTQVLQPESLTLYLVQALESQDAVVRLDADVSIAPPVPVGERPQSHGTCFSTLAWPTANGSFYLDRLRGLDSRPPGEMDDGMGHSTAHSQWWMMNLGGEYQHQDFDAMELDQDEWIVLGTGVSQVSPDEIRAGGENSWTVTLELEGPYRVIAIPGAAHYCLMGLKSMPGVNVDPFDVAFDGDLRVHSPYGAALEFRPYKAPDVQLVGPHCPPVGAYEGLATFNGEETVLGKDVEVAKATYDPAELEVRIDEWGCQSMQFLAVVGLPHPLTGTWWSDSRPPGESSDHSA